MKTDDQKRTSTQEKQFGTLARMAGNICDGLLSPENNHYVDEQSGKIDVARLAADAAEIAVAIVAELQKNDVEEDHDGV